MQKQKQNNQQNTQTIIFRPNILFKQPKQNQTRSKNIVKLAQTKKQHQQFLQKIASRKLPIVISETKTQNNSKHEENKSQPQLISSKGEAQKKRSKNNNKTAQTPNKPPTKHLGR